MFTGSGKSVFSGVAIGKAFLYRKQLAQISRERAEDPTREIERFESAKTVAAEQLRALFEKTLAEIGEHEAMILDVQLMMMDDGDFNDAVIEQITSTGANASYAVLTVGKQFSEMFANMDDDYMRARAVDVRDVSERLVLVLAGASNDRFYMEEPMVVIADDLSPSETVQFDKSKILAFVTRQGSLNSHTAILARMMNLPAIVGADIALDDSMTGKLIAVDGFTGKYYLEPDEETHAIMREKQKRDLDQKRLLMEQRGRETVTRGGKRIKLYANIGALSDLPYVLENDAEGIGLFRSEFLYLGRADYPGEEEQFSTYRAVVEGMKGKKVVIRTLDIGADKQADYFHLETEENPAMGYRAIRICLDRPEIFKTQLRALYRASAFGAVSIMFPMIISVAEVLRIREIVEEVKAELNEEKTAFGEVELGVMIETPAAVMMSDEIARHVDFFSVGTNDLTQYTLAIDRQNRALDNLYDPHHPAILRMLKIIVDNAHSAGIWAGICGELAADEALTETFLEMGYDELSVSPTFILALRKKIRESDIQ